MLRDLISPPARRPLVVLWRRPGSVPSGDDGERRRLWADPLYGRLAMWRTLAALVTATAATGILFWLLAGVVEPREFGFCRLADVDGEFAPPTHASSASAILELPERSMRTRPVRPEIEFVPSPQYLAPLPSPVIPFDEFPSPLDAPNAQESPRTPRGDFELRESTRGSASRGVRSRPSPAV